MNKFFKTSLAFLIAIFTIVIPTYGVQRGGPGHSTPDIQNRVTVGGWGANYSTIQGAIDGITDASASNWYTIQIAPGIYDENITGKDYVNLTGVGAGTVLVTDVDHGLTGTEAISISGTTNYNDVVDITVVNSDTFYFTHSWDGDDATGTWRHGTEVVINQRGTYLISWAFSADSEGVNKVYELAAYSGTTLISGTKIARNFSNANDIGSVSGTSITALEKDDHIYFAVRGTTDNTNLTFSEGNLTISKVN